MAQVTLRKLARKYSDGTIAKEEYRSSRAELLEGILSGKIELQVNEYLPPIVPDADDFLDITTDKPLKEEDVEITQFGAPPPAAAASDQQAVPPAADDVATSPEAPSSAAASQKLIWTGAAAGLVILIAIIIALLPGSDKESSQTASEETTTKETTVEPTVNIPANVQPGKAQSLIQEFLSAKNWSQTNINSFVIKWQALSDEDRAAAKGTVQLGQLTNAIYKKLLEERALSGLGDDAEVLEKQRQLVEFAEQVGINDSRIKLL